MTDEEFDVWDLDPLEGQGLRISIRHVGSGIGGVVTSPTTDRDAVVQRGIEALRKLLTVVTRSEDPSHG